MYGTTIRRGEFGSPIVELSIGNPPQTFKAIVDIGHQDLIVPSVHCLASSPEVLTKEVEELYDASKSSTSFKRDDINDEFYRTVRYSGSATLDTVTIAGIEIENQFFFSASGATVMGFMSLVDYDATLGLDRYPYLTMDRNELDAPSPWQSMIQRSLLEKNLFTFGQWNEEEGEGQLTFGQIDPAYAEELIAMPLSDLEEAIQGDLPSRWTIEAGSVTFGDLHVEDDFLVAFDSTLDRLAFPKSITRRILEIVGEKDDETVPYEPEDGSLRPDLKITLGPARSDFIITPSQYIQEITSDHDDDEKDLPEPQRLCCITHFRCSDEDIVQAERRRPIIVLGLTFLQTVYSVFDVDSQTTSRKPVQSNPRYQEIFQKPT